MKPGGKLKLHFVKSRPLSKVKKTMRSAKTVCVFLIWILFISATAPAEDHHIREGFWGGIDAGAGYLKRSLGDGRKDDTSFYLGFKAGYTINPHFLTGLELSGWILETSNLWDPDEGKGINQVFLLTQIYPSKDSGLFVKVGGGYASIWSNKPSETRRKSGWAINVGGGYDYFLGETMALTPFVAFNYGETGNWDYKAITLGLGITFP